MNKLFFIILMLVTSNSFGQALTSDSLITDFLSGRVFIVNQVAVADADSSFFQTLEKCSITSHEVLDSLKGEELYGTLGKLGITRVVIEKPKKLKKENAGLVDATILKHFNQEDSLFYHVNGFPCNNVYSAVNILINMKVDKVQTLGKNQGMALWGNQAKNGAVVINCNREEKLEIK